MVLVPLVSHVIFYLISELDEIEICILLVAAMKIPNSLGMRIKTRSRRSYSSSMRGSSVRPLFLAPPNEFGHVNLEGRAGML